MKKVIGIFALGLITFNASSCRETPEKETVIVKEVQVEKTEDREGILERTAKEVDNKVNDKIDQEIDNIDN